MNIPLQMKWIGGYIMKKFDFKDAKEKLTEGFITATEVAKKAIKEMPEKLIKQSTYHFSYI